MIADGMPNWTKEVINNFKIKLLRYYMPFWHSPFWNSEINTDEPRQQKCRLSGEKQIPLI